MIICTIFTYTSPITEDTTKMDDNRYSDGIDAGGNRSRLFGVGRKYEFVNKYRDSAANIVRETLPITCLFVLVVATPHHDSHKRHFCLIFFQILRHRFSIVTDDTQPYSTV